MKKIVCLLLVVLSVVMFAACTGKPEQTEKQAESHTEAPAVDSGEKQRLQQVLETVCSADEALELAKKSNAVVSKPRVVFSEKKHGMRSMKRSARALPQSFCVQITTH